MRVARLREIVRGARPTAARRPGGVAGALAGALAAALLAFAPGSTPAAAGALTRSAKTEPSKSIELWATVDLCNTSHHPDTIGIRGSMGGDGHARDRMYMRFLVQNLDVSTHKWENVGRSADSGFVLVGSGALARQAGRSFEFKPTATTFTLRGLVEFQWHHDGHTARSLTLPTTAGHTSLAGAEPAGFSAATCALP
jgi:hypothetical protein